MKLTINHIHSLYHRDKQGCQLMAQSRSDRPIMGQILLLFFFHITFQYIYRLFEPKRTEILTKKSPGFLPFGANLTKIIVRYSNGY